ncbi:hypothetical protein QJS04_geneDACA018572 [Acorus gramineus]|uniref:Uncharacterized protein n=1 Tax=Acorus gramineus TaxID=55184 RepID=A0AAV9AG87_ACOGR|nr:hypothetical protein QJS04_geneDACA018572 [Acorus gramineus]
MDPLHTHYPTWKKKKNTKFRLKQGMLKSHKNTKFSQNKECANRKRGRESEGEGTGSCPPSQACSTTATWTSGLLESSYAQERPAKLAPMIMTRHR